MSVRNLIVPAILAAAATAGFAQPNRILSKIDNSKTFSLQGRVHPLATAANDQGAVPGSFSLPYMTLMLHPSAAQQAQLQQLLQDQQNPASPSYHQWLTPEQYADRFGVSASDAAQIVSWLESQGFTVDPVSRSRTFVTFAGTSAQVQAAFGATIHNYKVNGQMHYANSTDLTIPAALSPMVAGIRGLHDFHPKPKIAKAKPNYTLGRGNYEIVPDDFATIYDVTPLYSAGTNGGGVSVAVVGQSAIVATDISHFWSTFGLTSVTLKQDLVNPRQNPGLQVSSGDLDESSLDLEWSSAVARGATIVFVYSLDVWDSAIYAVDHNVAQVLSMSYGECENADFIDLPSFRQLVLQANAEGITWLAAAGDQGAADCDSGASVAEGGLAVDEPGSIPEVTSMGGTMVSALGSYWNTSNTSTLGSAKSYIPETAWNEDALSIPDGQGILATGGGASVYFPQPAWQTNGGVPNDGWRHVPDLAFNASVDTVPYYVYCTQCLGSTNGVEPVGGTSAATPTMAGVVALLNQYEKASGLGNINPSIYSLFKTTPSAFHNTITGNNIVPCAAGSPECVNGQEGYTASGSGYSSVVGFGSIDVTKFIQAWTTASPTGPVVVASIDQNPVYQGFAETCGTSGSWNFVLTVSEEGGFATSITGLSIGGNDYSSHISQIFGTSAIGARQSLSGCVSLAGVSVPTNLAFTFSGPNWSTSLNIPFQGPQSVLNISAGTNAASYSQTYAPGMIMTIFGTGFSTITEAAGTTPLPEYMAGVQAMICPVSCATSATAYGVPLYYVGANQINLQIPIEVSGAVDLNLVNPYNPANGVDYYFTVSSLAPGIFMLEDGSGLVANGVSTSANPGQSFTVYITGQGRVSPTVEDGYSPGAQGLVSTPTPRSAVTVTVGGIAASETDKNWFVGVPSWSVGVTQVNFTIPSGVPTGKQPIVVTVGTVASAPAYVNIL
jgi:uncharacterized protein (TIGR03437 family)